MSAFWDEVKRREAEGKARAKANEAELREKEYRCQPSWALRNMVKALKIMEWENTVDDWQRYYEAKYILRIRGRR